MVGYNPALANSGRYVAAPPRTPNLPGAGMLRDPRLPSIFDNISALKRGGTIGGNNGGNGDTFRLPNETIRIPGYDNSGAIRAMYDQLQSAGRGIYRGAKKTIRGVYGDLIDAYTPLQENTGIRYNTAITGANEAQTARISEANARNAEQDAARLAQMERMGVAGSGDTGSGGASVDVAREKGIADTQSVLANWQGLMSAQNAAQQGRDASTLRGASDQKTMAMTELASRWSDYQNQLAQREAQAMQGATGGGGTQLNPFYANNPEALDMLHIQQGANQLGISPQEFMANFRKGDQAQGPDVRLLEMNFNSLADLWDQNGEGGVDAKRASDYRKANLTATDFYTTQ